MHVPQLRFDGFDGEWTELSLKEAIDNMVSGVSVNSIDKPARAGKVGVLKTSSISKGRFYPNENKEIIDIDVERAKLNPAKKTILISRMNTPQLVGEIGYVERDYQELFLPDRLWMVTTVSSVDSKWLTYLLVSEKYNSKILNLATGTSNSMKNISKESFFSLSIYAPNIKEQQKIASFLSLLDKKVKKQQEKIEKLEQFKKGMMQKIFLQELRFKGEDGDEFPEWKETFLGDIITTFSGGTPLSSNPRYYGGNIPFIRSGEIYGDATEIFITEEGLKNSSAKMVEAGDLLLALYGATSGEIAVSKMAGAINQAILCIRSNNSLSFIMHYWRHRKEIILKTYLQGGQGNISAAIVKNIAISLPCEEEQKKIGNYFDILEKKVEKEQEKLMVLEEQKKGFMQGMFV